MTGREERTCTLVSKDVSWIVAWLAALNSRSSREQYLSRSEKELWLGGHRPSWISLCSSGGVNHFILPHKSSCFSQTTCSATHSVFCLLSSCYLLMCLHMEKLGAKSILPPLRKAMFLLNKRVYFPSNIYSPSYGNLRLPWVKNTMIVHEKHMLVILRNPLVLFLAKVVQIMGA